jgi:predicted transcriptional regulator
MTTIADRKSLNRFDRWAMRVANLMTRNPRSMRGDATIREAVSFLTQNETDAAPVINDAGRPIGVLSLSDLVSAIRKHRIEEKTFFNLEVSRLMTPFVYWVNAETPIHAVVGDLLDYKIRQIYITDDDGVLVGVLSRADLLKDFQRDAEGPSDAGQYDAGIGSSAQADVERAPAVAGRQ